jgi:hypothetical protein
MELEISSICSQNLDVWLSCQLNPVYTVTNYFSKIRFNIIFSSMLKSLYFIPFIVIFQSTFLTDFMFET